MKQPDLRLPMYSIFYFTWTGNRGIVDASDLGLRAGAQPGERVWSDACDVGFWVCGRTRNVLFTLKSEDRHDDGEFRGWTFASDDGQFEINIIND